MKHHAVVLVAFLMVTSTVAIAQSTVDTPTGQAVTVSPFIGQGASIPDGYSLRLSAAYPPYERKSNSAYGSIAIGIAGMLEATVNHEGAIGSPIGLLRPATMLGLRLQIVPQRERLPAISLFLNTMTEAQGEFLGGNDLRSLPDVLQRGVNAISYGAKTTVAGISLTTKLNDMFSFSASLGGREMVWQQRWSLYSFNAGLPATSDGWTFPTAERSRLRLDWSASATIRPIEELALIGEVSSLPFIDIDPSSLIVEARQGLVGTVGVRYTLPIPLSVDLYDRWYSETRENQLSSGKTGTQY